MARDSLQNSTLASKSWQFPRDSKVLGVQPFFFFSFVCSFCLSSSFFFLKKPVFVVVVVCFDIEDMVDIVSSSSGIYYVTRAEHLYFNMKYFLKVAEYFLLTYLILSSCYPC